MIFTTYSKKKNQNNLQRFNFPNISKNFAQYTYETLRTAFLSYVKYCKGHDEFRPISQQCTDNFGFSATLLESLETLYLLSDKNLFSLAKKSLIRPPFISTLETVNRHEFWSRAIGSLIGTYILSKDKFFLNLAESLAEKMISVSSPFVIPPDFINLKNSVPIYNFKSEERTQLADILAGLPEVSALYILTKKKVFDDYSKRLIHSIPMPPNDGIHFHYYNLITKNPVSIHTDQNGSVIYDEPGIETVSFYYQLGTTMILRYSSETERLLRLSQTYLNVTLGEKQSSLYPLIELMEALSPYHFFHLGPNEVDFKVDAISRFLDPPHHFLNDNFTFYSGIPRVLIKKAFRYKSNLLIHKLKTMFSLSYSKCKIRNGFTSFTQNSLKKINYTDVQNSEFIGEWMKAALILLKNDSKITNAVFNERGHILSL